MNKSLLFLPDISGFTEFVQTTEVQHSQHVISELLHVLIHANNLDLELAEVEGDALFFFKEELPSLEKLLAQVESMFTAFYSHLELLKKNRICPCNACASAPNLQLKIIAHSGEIEFIVFGDHRKPFGSEVIQVHRLMKNAVRSDNYLLISDSLASDIGLAGTYKSMLFMFEEGSNTYDGKELGYLHSHIDNSHLKLKPFEQAREVTFNKQPTLTLNMNIGVSGKALLESITNYTYRHAWVDGVDRFEWNPDEVTRVGSEHVCVINGKHLDFVAVVKPGKPGQLIYGEQTPGPGPVDQLTQFYIITPLTSASCKLEVEVFVKSRALWKKLLLQLVIKKALKKSLEGSLGNLKTLLENGTLEAQT